MAEPARKRMTVADFLAWTPPGGGRWELYAGVPVAMAPAGLRHSRIIANVSRLLGNALDASPCDVFVEAGIRSPSRADGWYEADLAVACCQDDGRPDLSDPVLVIEILSPSTEAGDRRVKLQEYRRIASVREILLLDSTGIHAELHRRLDDGRWTVDLFDTVDSRLELASLGVVLPLADVYHRVGFAESNHG